MINPKLEQTIPRDQVIELIKDLIYIAVDMNIKYISVMEKASGKKAPRKKVYPQGRAKRRKR